MTNLTTTYATLCLCLTRTERGEVIVKEKTLIALVEYVVDELLVELGTQSYGGQRLCLTTGEDRASVRHGQRRNLAPDGADVSGLTASVSIRATPLALSFAPL